jgi:hypothetical protein
MVKKTYNDDLFVHMDWILKKKGKEPLTEESIPHSFILNRWLSMVDSSVALIINATTNKWITNRGICSDKMLLGKFYKKIMPKIFKKYSYIKKSSKEKSQNEYESIAKTKEISVREIEFYEKTLAELKQ